MIGNLLTGIVSGLAQQHSQNANKDKSKSTLKMVQLTKHGVSPLEFSRFENISYLCKETNKWTDQETLLHVLGNLHGNAADNARSLSRKIEDYTNLREFFQKLRERFVSIAHRAIAQVNFKDIVQQKDENIRSFHARLRTAWFDAFGKEEEPWLFDTNIKPPTGVNPGQPGESSQTLIKHFLQNLRSDVIRLHMRNTAHSTNSPYISYSKCLEDALYFSYSFGQLDAERRRFQVADRHKPFMPTFDSPHVHYSYTTGDFGHSRQGRGSNEVPAELSVLRKGKGKKKFGKKKSRNRGGVHLAQKATKQVNYCTYHKSEKHTTEQCRALKGGKKTGAGSSGQSNGKWKSQGQAKKTGRKSGTCHNCGKTGHWKNECRSSPKGEKAKQVAYLESAYPGVEADEYPDYYEHPEESGWVSAN